eukprot:g945.t1
MKKSSFDKDAMEINGLHRTVYFVEKCSDASVSVVSDSEPTKYKTGHTYTGEWKSSKRHGFGIQKRADGSKYEGHWKNNLRHGKGTMWIRHEGKMFKRYEGDWRKDTMHGRGSFFYDNGDKYDGSWMRNRRHGKGTMEYANGDIYEGHWDEDIKSGIGVLLYANGDRYEGYFENDKKEGPGRFYYYRTKKVYEGEWRDDVAKCGVYSDISEPQDYKDTNEDDYYEVKLPTLGLGDADRVLDEAVRRVDLSRKLRTSGAEVDRGSANEVFTDLDSQSCGYLTYDEVVVGLMRLGLSNSEDTARALLKDMGLSELSDVNFDAFLDVIQRSNNIGN